MLTQLRALPACSCMASSCASCPVPHPSHKPHPVSATGPDLWGSPIRRLGFDTKRTTHIFITTRLAASFHANRMLLPKHGRKRRRYQSSIKRQPNSILQVNLPFYHSPAPQTTTTTTTQPADPPKWPPQPPPPPTPPPRPPSPSASS